MNWLSNIGTIGTSVGAALDAANKLYKKAKENNKTITTNPIGSSGVSSTAQSTYTGDPGGIKTGPSDEFKNAFKNAYDSYDNFTKDFNSSPSGSIKIAARETPNNDSVDMSKHIDALACKDDPDYNPHLEQIEESELKEEIF